MTESHIVFYVPKSTIASIIGVILKIVLLLLPSGIMVVFIDMQDEPQWLWLIASVALGVVLMRKADVVIMPLIGVRHSFHFSSSRVVIRNAAGEKQVLLADLKALTAFDVPAEGGSVKHIVLEFSDGSKTDIFETWVTDSSTKDFDKLYHALVKSPN